MDFDAAYIEPFVQSWLSYIHQENEACEYSTRNNNEFCVPFMAVPMPVTKTIFAISEFFGLAPSARYLTVLLYDKFMCKHFYESYKTEPEAEPEESSWKITCERISSQAKLRLLSCMQLASKMDSHSQSLGVSHILGVLRWIDKNREYTHDMVLSSEFEVFKTLGYRVPLFTPLCCIEILLAATGLWESPEIYDNAINILDVAFLQHEQIYSQLHYMAHGRLLKTRDDRRNFMAIESNVLFLVASIVLCATLFMCADKADSKHLVIKLSHMVEIRDSDIWDMANLLFTIIVQDADL